MNHEFYLAFGMSSALGSTALVKFFGLVEGQTVKLLLGFPQVRHRL